ncbi:DUF2972 domain-containing protein, partial [Campylobacter jejuni]|nr:DUF2972 domain-containing protein [Campylobacter jejuni]
LGFGLSGHSALNLFLKKTLNVVSYSNSIEHIYSFFKSDACFFIFIHNMNDIEKVKKFLYRIYSQPVLFLTRDPIERLKNGVNHGWYAHPHQNIFDTYIIKECKIDVILDRVRYTNIKDYKVLFNNLQFWINSASFNYTTIRNCIDTQIFYLDMKDIMPNKAFNTIKKLSKILNFNPPKEENKDFYEEIKSSHFRYILPIILIYNDIKFYVTLKNEKENNYIDVEKYFNFSNEIKKYICFSVSPLDEVKLLNFINDKYLNDFFNNFLSILNKKFIYIKKSKITTNGILWCLKKNSELKKILKKILDEELIHIKQHRPDIVASWKYYQEFEKMCKELDEIN